MNGKEPLALGGAGKRERRHRADPGLCAREPSFGCTRREDRGKEGERESDERRARERALVVESLLCARTVVQPLFGAAAVLPPTRFLSRIARILYMQSHAAGTYTPLSLFKIDFGAVRPGGSVNGGRRSYSQGCAPLIERH